MNKLLVIAIVIAASTADAAGLDFTFFDAAPRDNVFDVYVEVTGDTTGLDGLLNFDIGLSGLVEAGIDSANISFTPVVFSNFSESFQPQGFPGGNFLQGPSGPDIWSAGHSQFNVAHPVAGIGITDVFLRGANTLPDNLTITFGVPALLGTLDLGTDAALSSAELEPLFTTGGTLYGNGDPSTPIAADSVPEPSSALLAYLVACLTGQWRRVQL